MKKINNVLNLTPHLVTYIHNYKKYNFKSDGIIRLEETEVIISEVNKIIMIEVNYDDVYIEFRREMLDNPTDYFIIVSLPTLVGIKYNPKLKKKIINYFKNLNYNIVEIIAPNTCDDSVIKDNSGNIIGVTSFKK